MLFKDTGRYDEGSRRRAVVVEASGLSWQPSDHPNIVVRTMMQPLIPSVFGSQPHPIYPFLRRRESRNDAGEFLGRP
jgi:hypothetical protein